MAVSWTERGHEGTTHSPEPAALFCLSVALEQSLFSLSQAVTSHKEPVDDRPREGHGRLLQIAVLFSVRRSMLSNVFMGCFADGVW